MVKKTHTTHSEQTSLAPYLAADQLNRSTLPQQSSTIYRLDQGGKVSWPELPNTADQPKGATYHGSVMGLDTVPFCNDQFQPDSTTYIQRARFYADKIIVYPEALNGRFKSVAQSSSLANLSRGEYNGFVSKATSSKIRVNLEGWIKSIHTNRSNLPQGVRAKHSHVTFPTLTLPSKQVHSDNEIKRKILMPFIQKLKRDHGVSEYFWKAEPQGNGNIHFHLLTDRYIDKDQLNTKWNVSCNTLGYLDRYVSVSGDINPPSTQIRVCPKEMSLVKYVMKYVCKAPIECGKFSRREDQQEFEAGFYEFPRNKEGKNEVKKWRKIEGRCWGMSDGIRKAKVFSPPVSYRVRDLLEVFKYDSSVKVVQSDFCEIYYCNVVDQLRKLDFVLFGDYRKFYIDQYRDIYRKPNSESVVEPKVIRLKPDQGKEVRKLEYLQLRASC